MDKHSHDQFLIETVLSPAYMPQSVGSGGIPGQEPSKPKLEWEVSPSECYGPPNALAQRLHQFLMTRWIREELPDRIRLGAVSEVCSELGLDEHDEESLKAALHQNASLSVTATICVGETFVKVGYSIYGWQIKDELLASGASAPVLFVDVAVPHRNLLGHVVKIRQGEG